MNKSLEWIKNIEYKDAVAIHLLIVFGWSPVFLLIIAYFLEKRILVISGVLVTIFILILLIKRKWKILLGMGSSILSTLISFFCVLHNIDLIGVWFIMICLIDAGFAILCSIESHNIPEKKRERMLLCGVMIIVMVIIALISMVLI